jgi:N-acetylmuramoyl-L-alanine amidase
MITEAYSIEKMTSPNFWEGRAGKKVIAIVNHITAGLMPGCLDWLTNPKSKASTHYLITKTGRIIQLVDEANTAWHCGTVQKPSWGLYDGTNPNRYTIGIEHEALPGQGLTDAQFISSATLHYDLVKRYGLSVDSEHIIGHYRIDSVQRPNDPGAGFPWDKLFNDLKARLMESITVTVKGQRVQGRLIDGLTWVPIRELVDKLNYSVYWNDEYKSVDVR